MAHKFIIDDRTGQLYSDFSGRRITTAAEILKAERGLSPTIEVYSVNVATDSRAVTDQTITNGNLSLSMGQAGKAPDKGLIKAAWTVSGTTYESTHLKLEGLTADALASAFNSAVYPVYIAGGLNVDQIGAGKYLLTMKKVGAISGTPGLDVEACDPPSAVEINTVIAGDSDTKAQYILSLAQSPVAQITSGSWSSATSGSYSGLSASISLNTTAMLASISRGQIDFEISIVHSGQVLHRSGVTINESLDPTSAGALVITSPNLLTLGSTAVKQGETIALGGGLAYDGTTLDMDGVTAGTASASMAVVLDANKDISGLRNVVIDGTVQVNGETTLINSTVVTIDDPIFTLGGDGSGINDSKDRGIEFKYNDGSAKVGFFGYDDSADAFTFLTDATNNTEVFSGTLGNLVAGDLTTLDINLTDPDVAHGVTNIAATNVFGNLTTIHGTQGGLYINGISDQESASARSLALRGICNDSHTDTVPTVEIIGAKRSGTTIQALADAETVLTIANHTTDLLTVLGSGATTFGGAVTVGANTDGQDVKFFAGTSGRYMLWEAAGDRLKVSDNAKICAGSSQDLQILHDGTNSIIDNTGGGPLQIKGTQNDTDIIFSTTTGSSTSELMRLDGSASAATFSGAVTVGADGAGHDVTFHSSTAGRDIHWDASAKTLNLKDLTTLGIGSSNDLQVYHTAHSYIENTTNNLYINNLATGKDTIFKCDDDSGTSTELLRLDGSASSISLPDSVKLNFGAPDLQIYHDGSNSHFKHTGTGSLYLRSSNFYFEKADGSETLAKFISDGSVELYYDNAKKFETLTDGVKVTGAMALTEVSTPTATADHGKVYTKTDNKLYFQDGAGTEHEIAFA